MRVWSAGLMRWRMDEIQHLWSSQKKSTKPFTLPVKNSFFFPLSPSVFSDAWSVWNILMPSTKFNTIKWFRKQNLCQIIWLNRFNFIYNLFFKWTYESYCNKHDHLVCFTPSFYFLHTTWQTEWSWRNKCKELGKKLMKYITSRSSRRDVWATNTHSANKPIQFEYNLFWTKWQIIFPRWQARHSNHL